MFEFDQQLYEMIFCACTSREEQQWRDELHERSRESEDEVEMGSLPISGQSMLSLDIKTLGFVFGQPGTLTRRQSIQRAATVSSRRNGHQIIIKKTNSPKENGETPAPEPECLSRSQSLLSTHRIPVLAPKRTERQRIETAMSDVWTRDRLPFPGMTGNRGSYLIQRSATSVMRKISKASMTTTISTKRTVSNYVSINENDSTPYQGSVNKNPDSTNMEIQRRVSFASMSDTGLGPGHIKIQRMTQTDGACSPPRDQRTPTSLSELEAVTTAMMKPLSAENLAKEGKLAMRQREGRSSMGSPTPRGTSWASGEPGRGRGKLNKSKTLLRAFSKEGILSWLN